MSGRVYSAAGPIRQVLVNGREATVEHGAFVARVEAHPGGNTLVIQATDAMGTTERRVQAFHFASRYGHADRAGANAIVARASTKTLATELSAVASQQLRALDLQKVLPEVVGHGPTHEVRLSSVRHEPVQVFVTPRDGGLAVQVSVARLRIGLVAEGGSMGCLDTRLLRLCRDYPDVYGALTVSQADVSARLWISASQGRPQVRLGRVQVSLTQPRVELGGLGALGSRLGTLVLRLVRGVIEQRLASTVAELLAGPLEQALDVVTMEGTLELEPLEPDAARLRVGLSTPVQRLSVTRDRVEVVLGARTRALARKPWRGGDVLQRRECPGDAPYVPGPGMEIEVSDDLLNRIMASAWRAGLLEFEIDRRVLARARLGRFGVTDLRVEVSGMLPPVISDCNPTRTPRLHVGDLVVNAELTLWGRPVTAKLFVSFEGGLALRPGSRYLRLVLTDVEWVDGELEVDSGEGDSAAHGSPLVGGILRRAVVPLLADELTGVVLAEVPLPRATLLEGEVRLMALEAVRRPGGTVLRASVKR